MSFSRVRKCSRESKVKFRLVKERSGGQRFNHKAALVSNYKEFVDKGASHACRLGSGEACFEQFSNVLTRFMEIMMIAPCFNSSSKPLLECYRRKWTNVTVTQHCFFNMSKLIQIETIRSKNIFWTLAKNDNLVFCQRGSDQPCIWLHSV